MVNGLLKVAKLKHLFRVDDLFKFLTHWVPDRYGPLGDVSAQGYELIDSDTEWDDDEPKHGQKVTF